MSPPPSSDRPADRLARWLFGLLALAALLTLAGGVLLLAAPAGTGPRTLLLAGYGVFTLVSILLCAAVLVIAPERLKARLEQAQRFIPRGRLAALVAGVILLAVLIVQAVIAAVAPSISALAVPAAAWGGVLIAVILIANQPAAAAWLRRTWGCWAALGLGLTAAVLFMVLFTGVRFVLEDSGLMGTLRGQSDPRVLIWYGGEVNPERARAYWAELGRLNVSWLPYTYSRIEPHQGELFTVSDAGLRGTANPAAPDSGVPSVYFFGGSTMWGEGSRDAYTIPSQVASILNAQGQPIYATNYGQVAYVLEQDLILFQRQLVLGRIPDVAVFYGGFNDLASVYMHDHQIGLPHNEVNRARDLSAGIVLRSGRPQLTYPNLQLEELDFSLMAWQKGTPEQVVEDILANQRIIRAMAREYGAAVLFVWQPAQVFKERLTPQEQLFRDENARNWPGFEDLYRQVDALLRARAAELGFDDVLFLSDLFAEETGYIFYDRVHVIEDGNTRIAEAIAEALRPVLSAIP